MNKAIALFVALTCVCATTGYAYSPGTGRYHVEDGARYEILDSPEKSVGLVGMVQGGEDFLFMPEEVVIDGETYKVTQINNYAFRDNSTFYYIHMPEGLTDIGQSAFEGAGMIRDIEFPSTLRTIGKNAFNNAERIEKLHLPDAVEEIGEGAFSQMPALKKIVMQNCAVTEIKASTFYGCRELEEVYLPLGVKSIGDYAFRNTLSLTELYFPEGLETIGEFVFNGQSYEYGGYAGGLSKIVLPSTLKEIGIMAFRETPLFEADLSKTQLTEIPEEAFGYCYNLSSLKLPNTLTTIGRKAFYSCGANASVGMIDLEIPDAVTSISKEAFGSTKITYVKIGDGMSGLPEGIFNEITRLELGEGIKNIDITAFKINSLRLLRLHAKTPPTFSSDYSLTEAERQNLTVVIDEGKMPLYSHHPIWSDFNLVEDGVSRVEVSLDGGVPLGEAIYNASGVLPSRITALKVSGHLTDTDLRVIKENMVSLTELDIEDTDLTEIPRTQFAKMTLLTDVKLPKNLTAIGDSAFAQCRSLRIAELPNSIKTIGTEAFLNCSSLQITKLPDALVTLGYRAFSNCISLRSIVAGENLEKLYGANFSFCRMLEYVDLSATKLTRLEFSAFYVCETLRTLLLPQSVRELRYRALAISGLRSLEIPGEVILLEEEVFYETPLRTISFGEGISEVPSGVFENCNYLVSASFPYTLKKVGPNLFRNSSRLRMMSCAAPEAPEAAEGAFDGILTQKSTLTIPKGSFSSYVSAPQWGKFGHFDCSLDVDVDSDIDVTVIPEDEYEDLEEEEQLLEEQAENQDRGITGEDPDAAARRKAARRAASNRLLDGSQFARVFNGAAINYDRESFASSLVPDKGNRYFINTRGDQTLKTVLYNGRDITDQVVDGILILPSNSEGLLEIRGTKDQSGISAVTGDFDGECDIFSLTGMKVFSGRVADFAPERRGFYIVRSANGASRKICI